MLNQQNDFRDQIQEFSKINQASSVARLEKVKYLLLTLNSQS